MQPARIMVVEDEFIVSMGIQASVEQLGYEVCCATGSGEEAVEKAKTFRPDLILMDIALRGAMDGIEAAEIIHASLGIPVIFLTAYSDEEKLDRAKRAEPFGYLIKPYENRELKAVIEMALFKAGMEEKLRASEEWLSTTLRSIGDAVIATDCEGKVSFINPVAQALTGWNETEAAGRPLREVFRIVNEESREEIESPAARVMREGTVVGLANHTLLIAKDGREIPIDDSGAPVRDSRGNIMGVVLVFRDVTERKRAEKAIRESERHFRLLYENAPVGYQSLDENGRILDVNRSWRNILGYSKEEIVGTRFGDLLTPRFQELFRNRFPQFKAKGEVRGVTFEMKRRDGTVILAEFDGTIGCDEQGRFKQTHCTMRDITETRQVEEAIHTLFKSTAGIIGKDFFDNIVGSLCEWLGCDCAIIGEIAEGSRVDALSMQLDGTLVRDCSFPLAGSPCEQLTDRGYCAYPEGVFALFPDVPMLRAMGVAGYVGTALRSKNNETIGVLCALSRKRLHLPAGAEEVMAILAAKAAAEIERKRIEQEKERIEIQLRQIRKMEAIGALAGGIAHDFNNILSPIIGYTEMTLDDLDPESPFRKNLREVLKAAHRARDLVSQILTFSRPTEQQKQPVLIAGIVEEALKLLRATIPSSIEIRQEIDPAARARPVIADSTQIHQVLMNLCTNAAHAMRGKAGLLEVALREVRLDAAAPHPDLTAGEYLKLSVRDTGHGMDRATLERIFDPFFTTKERGEGTGMGLAVVHGIVKGCGGAVAVTSRPDHGSTFDLFFPIARSVYRVESKPAEVMRDGHERILFIDDETLLVEMGKKMLEKLGYRVTIETVSVAALRIFKARPDDFDLVITDYTMPHMTGMDLAKEMIAIRPDMPIILCTGYSEMLAQEKIKAIGIRELVMKPVRMAKLAEVIRKVMDGS